MKDMIIVKQLHYNIISTNIPIWGTLDDIISKTSIDNMLIWCHMALPMIH